MYKIFFTVVLLLGVTFSGEPTHSAETVSEGMQAAAQPLMKALSLLGTPYKRGSSDPDKGVDCSGFVGHVYKESANVSLPRTAKAMSKQGEAVAGKELKPGDLVFFNTLKKPFSHVGIYKGQGEFIHASSRAAKQVTVSRMDDVYWSSHYNGARRVLPAQP